MIHTTTAPASAAMPALRIGACAMTGARQKGSLKAAPALAKGPGNQCSMSAGRGQSSVDFLALCKVLFYVKLAAFSLI